MSYASHYANFFRAQQRARCAFVLSVTVALAAPAHTASAQIGGLVKRARDKVVEQKVDKEVEKRTGSAAASSGGAAPTFDEVTLELTSDRVGQIIRGLSAGRALLDGANGSPSRATLVARRDAAMSKRETLSSENTKAFDAYYEKRDANQRCREDAVQASSDKREQGSEQRTKELQAKAMTDPAFREKIMAYTQKAAAAQQRGDTAELRRLSAELGVVGDDPRADSLAADKACGREPARPAAMAQIEQLDAQAKELTGQIRQLEEKAAATELKESGLNERQYFVARERIEAYLSAMKYKSQARGFSATELDALGARRSELERVM